MRARVARATALVAVLAAAPAAAYLLPGPAVLRRLAQRRADLGLASLELLEGEARRRNVLAGVYRSQAAGRVRMSTSAAPHEGLGVQHYAWASSPLRRYADLVNQRQLLAAARGKLGREDFRGGYDFVEAFGRPFL